jgi:hypothetical protein
MIIPEGVFQIYTYCGVYLQRLGLYWPYSSVVVLENDTS